MPAHIKAYDLVNSYAENTDRLTVTLIIVIAIKELLFVQICESLKL